jgi:CheY-like chemotaxis protein
MRRIKFLVADDSQTVRNLISHIIKSQLGADIIHLAKNGQEAFDVFEREEIDFVISDWDMPVMSGEEFLYKVRNESGNRDVPFLMVTSHDEKDFLVTAIQNGVSQYIVKPFTPEEMEQKILQCWNAASKRKGRRYADLPRHVFTATFKNAVVEASLVDISRVGAVVELNYNEEITLFKGCTAKIAIELPGTGKMLAIGPIVAMVVRLEASDSLHPTSRLCNMALYFSPTHTPTNVQEKLAQLIKWLHSRLPDAVHDLAKGLEEIDDPQ